MRDTVGGQKLNPAARPAPTYPAGYTPPVPPPPPRCCHRTTHSTEEPYEGCCHSHSAEQEREPWPYEPDHPDGTTG